MKPRILIGSLLALSLFLPPAVSQVQPKKAVFDGQAAKDQYYKLLGEMFKAKYENADLTQLFSGSFMSVLNRVKTDSSAQARVTVMMF
jgi:hypothetical protein